MVQKHFSQKDGTTWAKPSAKSENRSQRKPPLRKAFENRPSQTHSMYVCYIYIELLVSGYLAQTTWKTFKLTPDSQCFFFRGQLVDSLFNKSEPSGFNLLQTTLQKLLPHENSMLKTTKPPDKWPDRSCPHHHFSRGSVKLNWCSWNWYSPKLWVANKLKKNEKCFGTHPVIGSMSWLYKTVWPMRPIACTVTVQPKIWGLTLHGRLMKGAIFGLKTLAFCDHHRYQDHQWNHPGFKHDFVTRKCCSSDINKALDVNFKKNAGKGEFIDITHFVGHIDIFPWPPFLAFLNIMAGPPIPPP